MTELFQLPRLRQNRRAQIASGLLTTTKTVHDLFVVSQDYSFGFCQAVFLNLTHSLQLHVKTI